MAEDLCHYAVPALTTPENSVIEALPFCELLRNRLPDTGHDWRSSIVQHFPRWFPGTHYAYVAMDAKKYVRRLYEYPYSDIEDKMVCCLVLEPASLLTQCFTVERNGKAQFSSIPARRASEWRG